MTRLVFVLLIVLSSSAVFAQHDTIPAKPKPIATLPRSNDHFMLQFGYTSWQGKPDSIKTGKFPRTFNAYVLLDFPFKTSPSWSVAAGAGIATDNMFFDKTEMGIKDATTQVRFINVSDTTSNRFKKYKLATAYLEAPVELRFNSKPDNNKAGLKIAIGAKVGTLVNAHIKGKNLQNSSGATITAYTLKENSKRFFNQNRISATARLGFGHFSLFGSYQITPLFKEGLGPKVNPMTIGLNLSGL